MREVVMVSGARTAIGDFMGSLTKMTAVELGTVAAIEAIKRAGIKPEDIDNVMGGHCMFAGTGGNIARQIQGRAGILWEAPAATVHQACGSSMRALEIATEQILLGKSDIALVIGAESMTNVPYVLQKARFGYRLGDGNDGPVDELVANSLICPIAKVHMAITAENVAEKYNVSREEQDELALLSHQRASKAIKDEIFKDEIVGVEVKTKKETKIFDVDEHVRHDASLEGMAKLKPAFKKDGTVTAGNASGINDGACAAVIMTKEKAESLGLTPMCKIVATASAGVAPEIMGIGPVYAIPKVLKYAGLELKDIDLFEINEAFAAQFVGVSKELNLDIEKVNVNGSGIALGHPVGMTGLRLVISLAYEMARRDAKFGVASLCAGMGPAPATVIERI
ncbi:MAG: thiolase family protein [Dehalobacterium sp.]